MIFIDKLTKVLAEYKSLGIAEQIDYDKFYLYSLITHSPLVSEKVDRKRKSRQKSGQKAITKLL